MIGLMILPVIALLAALPRPESAVVSGATLSFIILYGLLTGQLGAL